MVHAAFDPGCVHLAAADLPRLACLAWSNCSRLARLAMPAPCLRPCSSAAPRNKRRSPTLKRCHAHSHCVCACVCIPDASSPRLLRSRSTSRTACPSPVCAPTPPPHLHRLPPAAHISCRRSTRLSAGPSCALCRPPPPALHALSAQRRTLRCAPRALLPNVLVPIVCRQALAPRCALP